jgi:DNA-binding response OmpR family regulator
LSQTPDQVAGRSDAGVKPGAVSAGDPVRLKVIVVEDEMMIALLLEDMLSDLGHTVVGVATRLEAALSLAETVEADLAILDVNLNGEASFPVARALGGRGVPFLFATGYGSTGLEAPFQNSPTLRKPFELNDLSLALKRMAAQS